MRHFICLSLLTVACVAHAADGVVALIGVIGNKAAVLSLDGGDPKTVKLGQTWNGISVLAVEKDGATIELKGEKRLLHIGQHYRAAATSVNRGSVVLSADPRGHFFADGAVNRVPVRFMVDTGATVIALPRREAERLGLDYRSGERGVTSTANGPVAVYHVKLDSVRVGGIEMHNVDAMVLDGGLDLALLGMSFLNRVQMQRDGATMILIQRF
ncbi:MAG: TIGR02281 family clan AA aspartic protease [Betaproteobacteria bacterium]|nr:TIGR02281 family clan AA aspartic protease [Betaproteobacteria bacterium]